MVRSLAPFVIVYLVELREQFRHMICDLSGIFTISIYYCARFFVGFVFGTDYIYIKVLDGVNKIC